MSDSVMYNAELCIIDIAEANSSYQIKGKYYGNTG